MRCIISFLLIFIVVAANARQISQDEAKSVAAEFFSKVRTTHLANYHSLRTVQKATARTKAETQPYYVFNAADNAGFVIISGDDRARKILGYSNKGSFDFDNMPPQLASLLEQYGRMLETIPASQQQDPSWKQTSIFSTSNTVAPLIKTKWDQNKPYNNLCPIEDGINCPTGCVATAMAQILYYYRWPEYGSGTAQGITMNGVRYDWDNMLLNYNTSDYSTNEANAIATLMRHCGAALKMEYSQYGSGAETRCAPFVKYFGFDGNAHEIKRSRDNDFEEQIRNELRNERPVLFGGQSSYGEAHAFVVDGFEANDYFHINYGWGGSMDGYYYLNLQSSDSQEATEFLFDQSAYIGLQPYRGEPVSITIDESHFPAKVCEYLKGLEFDINADGILSYNEINGTDLLVFRDMDLESLGDIDVFRGVTRMHCDYNRLTELNLSNYPYLTWISCEGNDIVSLDISKNPSLEVLICQFNKLSKLDVSKNPYIETLYCGYNEIYNIDVSMLPVLKNFTCERNQLSALDITHNPLLSSIRCDYNHIEELDITNCPLLRGVNCERNQIKALDISKAPLLDVLYTSGNNLTELDITNNPLLENLSCSENKLTNLNVSNNPKLINFACYRNQLSELDLSMCPFLIDINCFSNNLNSLLLPESTALKQLGISHNQLTAIDVSQYVNLTDLDCSDNKLTELNVTCNSRLEHLYCGLNAIEMLDVSMNPKLELLHCEENQLTEINLSSNKNLKSLYISNNKLKHLSISDSPHIENVWAFSNNLQDAIITGCSALNYLELNSNPLAYAHLFDIPEDCTVEMDVLPLEVELDDNLRFDTNTIPGFEIGRVKDISGGSIQGHYIIFDSLDNGDYPIVDYKYDTGAKEFDFSMRSSKPSEMVVKVSDILINPNSLKLTVGKSAPLTATVNPDNAANRTISWMSLNKEIASVNAEGIVSAVSVGTTTIIASANDGSDVSAECQVIVEDVSGIEELLADEDANVRIYTTTGHLIFNGKYSNAKLSEGVYIVVTKDNRYKLLIK